MSDFVDYHHSFDLLQLVTPTILHTHKLLLFFELADSLSCTFHRQLRLSPAAGEAYIEASVALYSNVFESYSKLSVLHLCVKPSVALYRVCFGIATS